VQTLFWNQTLTALDSNSFHFQTETLSKRLKEANPEFQEFSSDDYLELSLDKSGIPISIYANQIEVSVPYWHTDEKAKEIFKELFVYLDVRKRETGYSYIWPSGWSRNNFRPGRWCLFEYTYLSVSENLQSVIGVTDEQHKSFNNVTSNYFASGIIIILGIIVLVFFQE